MGVVWRFLPSFHGLCRLPHWELSSCNCPRSKALQVWNAYIITLDNVLTQHNKLLATHETCEVSRKWLVMTNQFCTMRPFNLLSALLLYESSPRIDMNSQPTQLGDVFWALPAVLLVGIGCQEVLGGDMCHHMSH